MLVLDHIYVLLATALAIHNWLLLDILIGLVFEAQSKAFIATVQ